MQSYALGATTVLGAPVNRSRLRAGILGPVASFKDGITEPAEGGVRVAAAAAAYIDSMFEAVMRGIPVDVKGAADLG
ncbi:hypothetical protein ABTE82_19540, partial [Acinetobacter baumannii]